MKRILTLSLLLLFSLGAIKAQENNNYPFQNGERVDFVISYAWGGVITDVASMNLKTLYENGEYKVTMTAGTYRFFDLFFKVRESLETKFSEETLRPSFFHREALEGKYRMKNTLTFNPSDFTIKSRTQKYDRVPYDTLLRGTEKTKDLLTLFYYYRTVDFTNAPVGEKVPMEFVVDKEIYSLYFIFKGREKKHIPGVGTFNTMKFMVKVVLGNVFDGKEDMTLWVSDDKNKVPLYFEAQLKFGKVQGHATKLSGTKYPLSSKIK
ncbi:MAG: DUF3108 domain-containing protein [Bacteroidales bacterium]|nr:DUF3108 domain-containing protein [Bacteroidales bacterium]